MSPVISFFSIGSNKELLFNISLIIGVFLFYAVGINTYNLEIWNKRIKFIVILCFGIVLYYEIGAVMIDPATFFGDRRGFWAKEYLLFGRPYEFSLGVTHLNLYLNFILAVSMGKYIDEKKGVYIWLFLLSVVLGLLTQSRSPILFVIILILLVLIKRLIINSNLKYFLYFAFTLACITLMFINIVSSASEDGGNGGGRLASGALMDASRLFFYMKGIEHLIQAPLGNNLLDSDESMPLKSYHNAFLSSGNRLSVFFFALFLIVTFFFFIRNLFQKENSINRYTNLFLLYYCLHNFMLEDIIQMDRFVFLFFFYLMGYLQSEKLNVKVV